MNAVRKLVVVIGGGFGLLLLIAGIVELSAANFGDGLLAVALAVAAFVSVGVVVDRGITAGASVFAVAFVALAIVGGVTGITTRPGTNVTDEDANATATQTQIPREQTPNATAFEYEADDDSWDSDDGRVRIGDNGGCNNDGDPGYHEDNDRDNDGICDEG